MKYLSLFLKAVIVLGITVFVVATIIFLVGQQTYPVGVTIGASCWLVLVASAWLFIREAGLKDNQEFTERLEASRQVREENQRLLKKFR